MSIVRIGLAETKGFGEGFEAIFGKKKEADAPKKAAAKPKAKKKSANKKK